MKVQNYLLTQQIGSGSFSTVYKAVDIGDQTKIYAIKSMREIPQNDQKAVRKQIDLLKEIKHKNVVNYIADFKEKNKWYIVFEYCGKGDLENYLKKQGRLPEIFCKNFASSIIDALSQLHSKGIAHRDLKLSNILINDQYDFKIADFGMAKIQKDGILESYCGTPYAMAPQVLKKQNYNIKCDTWSLGVMLYQLVYGRLPFDSRKNGGGIFGLTMAVLQDQPYFNPSVVVSEECINFIKLCLRKDPNQRPTMQKLAQNPWLSFGVGSAIRKDFLKQTFQQTTTLITKKTKQILHDSIEQHIKLIIKEYKLIDTEVAKYFSIFDRFYKDSPNVRLIIAAMIAKIVTELKSRQVVIEIERKEFVVKLIKVQIFKNHIGNLQAFLGNLMSKFSITNPDLNLQRQLVTFTINQAQSCLTFTQNYPQKISLLRYLSKLPLHTPQTSRIAIKQGFTDLTIKAEQALQDFLQKMTEQEMYKIINRKEGEFGPGEGEGGSGEKNWIVEHDVRKERREGTEIGLGEYVCRVIEINCAAGGE